MPERLAPYAALCVLLSAATANAGATFTTFDIPASVSTWAESINSGNTVAGEYENDSAIHGFLRTADGTVTTFDPPDSFETFPSASMTPTLSQATICMISSTASCARPMARSRFSILRGRAIPTSKA